MPSELWCHSAAGSTTAAEDQVWAKPDLLLTYSQQV